MPRPKGSAKLGQVRSLRLPLELDEWFERRLREDVRRCASDVLLEAVHGGLRLQPGYMWRQRVTLTSLAHRRRMESLRLVPCCARRYVRERVRQAYRCVAAGGRHFTFDHGGTSVAAGFEFIVRTFEFVPIRSAAGSRLIVAGWPWRGQVSVRARKALLFSRSQRSEMPAAEVAATLQQAPCKPKRLARKSAANALGASFNQRLSATSSEN